MLLLIACLQSRFLYKFLLLLCVVVVCFGMMIMIFQWDAK